jgi:hypothetical protein
VPVPSDSDLDRRIAALNAGDLDAWEATYHPGVTVSVEDVPGAGVFRGRREWRRWVESYREAWQNEAWTVLESRRLGDDRLICRWRMVGEGAGSGTPVDRDWSTVEVYDEDGLCVAAAFFADHADALRAAGLEG